MLLKRSRTYAYVVIYAMPMLFAGNKKIPDSWNSTELSMRLSQFSQVAGMANCPFLNTACILQYHLERHAGLSVGLI